MLDAIVDLIFDVILGLVPDVVLKIVCFVIGAASTAVGATMIGESTQIGGILIAVGVFLMIGTLAVSRR
ncbi:MAG: hypothetical protein A07HR67_02553 [uncultured archaeon A07HR67]|nr:MAG: hypothetical protein A07HR67_02553 [uncultured archaeon A07HR67]